MSRVTASGVKGARDQGARRYPGIRSFADHELDRALFHGRDREQSELLHLVLAERLSVLFARSGMGKTSLINAGLLAPLRRREHWPIVVRVNDTRSGPLPTIYDGIERSVAGQDIEYVAGDQTSLWHFFKTVEFWSGDTLLTPVLIIDQFEELFTLQLPGPRKDFIDQLADLVRGTRPRSGEDVSPAPPALSDRPPNVKVVLSLREDFLASLEELAARIPGILGNRFRLGPLRRETARSAIVEPARLAGEGLSTDPFSWSQPAIDRLLDFLSQREAPERTEPAGEVEPFQLQLLCRHLESVVEAKQASDHAEVEVRLEDLGDDDGLRDILSGFYEEMIAGTRARFADVHRGVAERLGGTRLESSLQRLCEYGLITDGGRRLIVEESDIQRRFHIDAEILDELVDRRLLRREPRIDHTRYYELTHDTLIAPILASRQRRERKKRARRRKAAVITGGLLIVLLVGFLGTLYSAQSALNAVSRKLNQTQGQLEKTQGQLDQETRRAEELTSAAWKGLGRKSAYESEQADIDRREVEEGLRARKLAEELAARSSKSQLREVVIWYFPKLGDDVDLGVVLSTLEGYGFRLSRREPKNQLRTNAMWLASTVTVEEAKMIAFTLVAAGVRIQTVQRFKSDSRYRNVRGRLVQVGAIGVSSRFLPLTVDDIENAGELPWYSSRR